MIEFQDLKNQVMTTNVWVVQVTTHVKQHYIQHLPSDIDEACLIFFLRLAVLQPFYRLRTVVYTIKENTESSTNLL